MNKPKYRRYQTQLPTMKSLQAVSVDLQPKTKSWTVIDPQGEIHRIPASRMRVITRISASKGKELFSVLFESFSPFMGVAEIVAVEEESNIPGMLKLRTQSGRVYFYSAEFTTSYPVKA